MHCKEQSKNNDRYAFYASPAKSVDCGSHRPASSASVWRGRLNAGRICAGLIGLDTDIKVSPGRGLGLSGVTRRSVYEDVPTCRSFAILQRQKRAYVHHWGAATNYQDQPEYRHEYLHLVHSVPGTNSRVDFRGRLERAPHIEDGCLRLSVVTAVRKLGRQACQSQVGLLPRPD